MGANKNREQARELLEALLEGEPTEYDDEGVGTISTKLLGTLGEELAAWYLEERGYTVIERNYRCEEGEADIVALDEDSAEVVLIEVKTRRKRRSDFDVYPEEAVTPRKQQTYRRIAYCYAAEHFPVPAIRFDVIGVGIDLRRCARCGTIHHVCGAFDWEADQ